MQGDNEGEKYDLYTFPVKSECGEVSFRFDSCSLNPVLQKRKNLLLCHCCKTVDLQAVVQATFYFKLQKSLFATKEIIKLQ
jgi:hypothetical protein